MLLNYSLLMTAFSCNKDAIFSNTPRSHVNHSRNLKLGVRGTG